MHWSLDADLRNEAIAAAMSRNQFREILRYIHFSDNLNASDNYKYAKIRPLITHLNDKYMTFLPSDAGPVGLHSLSCVIATSADYGTTDR